MYDNLFSPVRIGGLEIKNRVAMTPMGVNLAAAGGGVNDDIVAFYEARARSSSFTIPVATMASGASRRFPPRPSPSPTAGRHRAH